MVFVKHKLRDWVKRYGFAEIFAALGAFLSAYILFLVTKNPIIAAYGGVIGDNTGYYGTIIIRDVS